MLIAASVITSFKDPQLRQPKMIGEILAGVLLGPSILGRFAPARCSAPTMPTRRPWPSASSTAWACCS